MRLLLILRFATKPPVPVQGGPHLERFPAAVPLAGECYTFVAGFNMSFECLLAVKCFIAFLTCPCRCGPIGSIRVVVHIDVMPERGFTGDNLNKKNKKIKICKYKLCTTLKHILQF